MQFNLGRPSAKNINVQLAGVPLERVSEYTYLGFKIDNFMKFTPMYKGL